MASWLVIALCIILLIFSNVFMNLAWYGHLQKMSNQPIFYAILVSWLIAFFEYCLMIPANRMAHDYFTIGQLKIMQEAITLSVFIPISIYFFKEKWTWDYLWASLCMIGAIFFCFRSKLFS